MIEKYYSDISVKKLFKDDNLVSIHKGIENYVSKYFKFDFDPKNPVVRLHEPTFGSEEIKSSLNTLLSTKVTSGESVIGFEKNFAQSIGVSKSVTSNSGSSANLLSVAAICNPKFPTPLKKGDEVIVSALSWSTTVWPLIQYGLVPVLVDIDLKTFNISIDGIRKAISSKTRAIMPVHVYGNPCDMDDINSICEDHNLILIEDCCEALGAKYDEKVVGNFGLMGNFSFYFSHHITTLEGGITVTKDKDLADLLKIIRAHGWIRDVEDYDKYILENPTFDPRFLFVNDGYNLRLTELQAGFGIEQLPKLQKIVSKRIENTNLYKSKLSDLTNIFSFQDQTEKGVSSCFGFPLLINENSGLDIKELTLFLNENSIETRAIICGNIAKQPAMKLYDHRISGELMNADKVMDNGFSVGNHQNINEEAIEYVVEKIREYVSQKG